MIRKFKNMSFKYRLFCGFLCLAIVPVLFYSPFVINIYKNRVMAQTKENAVHQLAETSQRVESMLEGCTQVAGRVAAQRDITWALLDNTNDITKEVNLTLYQSSNELLAGVSVSLYDAGGRLHFTTGNPETTLPLRWGVLRKANQASGEVIFYAAGSSEVPLQVACSLYQGQAMLVGYLVIDIPNDILNSVLTIGYDMQAAAMLLDAQANPVYASPDTTDLSAVTALRMQIAGGNLAAMNMDANNYYVQQLTINNYYVVLRQSTPVSDSATKTLLYVSIATALASSALCVVFSLVFSRSLSQPISKLAGAMNRLKQGDMNARIHSSRKDELGALSRDFDRMADELDISMQQTIESERRRNQAQISLMQAQLNPHFLYNTLDTVKWLAKINNVPEIAAISTDLATILRQCASSKQLVPLREELDMLESYIKIQRIRFSDRFEFTVQVPQPLLHAIVPKLILQPLVENAIIHGLAEKPGGHLYIYATNAGADLQISITDDGHGMPQALIDKMLSGSADDYREGHLGVHNVNHILKMNYGEQYGLQIHSIVETGTTVTVKLPLLKGELKYDAGSGS